MDLYLLLIVILIIVGSQIFIKNFNRDYMSKESTSCVKGIFILFVFFQHIKDYIKISKKKNFLILSVKNWMGQLIVTLFLFYSGYGVYESIKKKKNYVRTIPKNRIFKTWFHFAIAVTLFVIVNSILGIKHNLYTNIFAYIGWTGIGNSNWYIFGILVMYLVTYISFVVFENNDKYAIRFAWILSLVFLLFMNKYRAPYWYNTLLCYPFGMSYSLHKKDIDKNIFNNKKYIIVILISLFSLITFKRFAASHYMYYEFMAISFVVLIVALTMKINIRNKILKWLGDNLFWIYILQRLPMIWLHKIGYSIHPYRFFIVCFAITIFLTLIVKYIVGKIDKLLFVEKKHS